jgi:hypothetical protein
MLVFLCVALKARQYGNQSVLLAVLFTFLQRRCAHAVLAARVARWGLKA